MRKWMVQFLRKFENRGTKIARVNSILITKSINLQLFSLILYGVRSSLIVMLPSLNKPVVLRIFIENSINEHIQCGYQKKHVNSTTFTCLPVKLVDVGKINSVN